ncbi:MAG: hypothetical protein H6871_09090 [Methylobacteriaceae bacterium]|nr:hypothetical protein [Methylobacteriaceae bacterium]
MFRPSLVFSSAALILAGATAAPAANDAALAKNLFGAAPGALARACFTRQYDARHMAAHRGQRVSAMKVLVTRETMPEYRGAERYRFRLSASLAGKSGLFESSGECTASSDGALVCGVECDGGQIVFAPRPATQSVRATVEYLRIWRLNAQPEEGAEQDLSISGGEDKLFRLDRAPSEACRRLLPEQEQRPQVSSLR